MTDNNTRSGGIGFIGLLTIVFIVLKLLGKITWTWFWVLSPIIFPAILAVVIIVIVLIILLVKELTKY